MSTPDATSPRRHRSPSYPSIDLATALDRIEQVGRIAGRHAAPLTAVAPAWGFSTKSSGVATTAATLRQFGLAEVSSGKIGLTPSGHELLVYGRNRASSEWSTRIERAALTPPIYEALWEKYSGDLPSDSAILPDLVLEMGFSEASAKDLLRHFRKTIEFASLMTSSGSDSLPATSPEEGLDITSAPVGSLVDSMMTRPPFASPGPPATPTGKSSPQVGRSVQLPYAADRWALLHAEFPMSGREWDQMLAVLQAMKPALVSDSASEPSRTGTPTDDANG